MATVTIECVDNQNQLVQSGRISIEKQHHSTDTSIDYIRRKKCSECKFRFGQYAKAGYTCQKCGYVTPFMDNDNDDYDVSNYRFFDYGLKTMISLPSSRDVVLLEYKIARISGLEVVKEILGIDPPSKDHIYFW